VARVALGNLLKIMAKEETDKVKAEGLRKASKVLTSLHDIGALVTVVTGYLIAVSQLQGKLGKQISSRARNAEA